MVSGAWIKRQGEQVNITNDAGGQIIEYAQTPPVQAQIAPIPQFVFEYMSFLTSTIEEQGVSTNTLGKIPKGVKANAAIESLKESEYSNLVMPTRRLKQTLKNLVEKLLYIADKYFVEPKDQEYLDKGKPQYFSVIGASALSGRRKLKLDTPDDVIPIKSSCKVDIEIQSGMAFTREGKRATAKELIDTMLQYSQAQLIPPEAIKIVLEKYLENYQFGATAEFMDVMDSFLKSGQTTPTQTDAVKVAVLEVMKDLIKNGILPDQNQRIQEQKVATAEVIKDTGLMKGQQSGATSAKGPNESISYKDLPPEGQAQMAAQAGIQLDPNQLAAMQAQEEAQQNLKTVVSDKGQQIGGGK
jgi:hypothetical protein